MLDNKKIIVSLTSYPARIKTVHKTIETLLAQSQKADMIILNLGEDKFINKEDDLPSELVKLTTQGLTINWCKDIGPFTKLIPTLKKYPKAVIITADDILYNKNWLKKLYNSYLKEPNLIHCHRAHLVLFDKQNNIRPYQEWTHEQTKSSTSFNNFLTGVGGVLYPPNCFYKDIFKEDIFMQLTPNADDIWFWAMALLNDTKIKIIKNKIIKLKYIKNSQKISLYHQNLLQNKNDAKLQAVINYYPQIKDKLEIITKVNKKIKLFKKEKSPNGGGVFYLFGIKILSYKKRGN